MSRGEEGFNSEMRDENRDLSHDLLERGNTRLREVVDTTPALIHTARPDGSVDFLNQGWLDFVGLPAEKLLGWGWMSTFHSEDIDACMAKWRGALASGEPFEAEGRIRRADGVYRTMLHRKAPLRNERGEIVKWYGSSIDIEDLKRTRAELRESEERFRRMADVMPEVIWITSINPKKVLYASPSFERIWGLSVQDLLNNPHRWMEAIHPDDRERVEDVFNRWITGEDVSYHDIEYRVVQPDGSVRWIHERGVLTLDTHGTPSLASGISTDISERKRAEDRLRRSETELREIVDAIPHAIVVLTPDGKTLRTNQYTLEFTGLNPEEAQSRTFRAIHPDDAERLRDARQQALVRGIPFQLELRALGKDGQYRWFLVHYKPLRDEHGSILRWYATGTDIDDRKRAEDALRESEQRFQLAIDTIPGLVWSGMPDGHIDFLNQRWREYTGLTLQEAGGWGWQAAIHPDDVAGLVDYWKSILASGEPGERIARLRRFDGTYRWFLFRGVPLRDELGKIVKWYGQTTDIDDRKRAEEELRRALDEIKKLKDQLYNENVALRDEVDKASMFEEIVGESPALQTVLARVAKVAPMDSTVLITGETGTGKELVARAIYKRSHRSSRAFISVNCAAIPTSLIASELFGHEKGAFTGATQRRLGRFELAEGGTIFLDEVGELPQETQIMLLRVLQEREFERVGGSHSIRTDVRVIAATNRNLESAIKAGAFRSDLFYRLNVFPLDIPPLRKRRDDIPMLVEYFIDRYARKAGKKIRSIEDATLRLLQSYIWPGNIRELQNVIERSVILCETEVFSVDPSWISRDDSPSASETRSLTKMSAAEEKQAIEEALAQTNGRIAGPSGAAARLGIPSTTLESKIKALRINKHRFKTA